MKSCSPGLLAALSFLTVPIDAKMRAQDLPDFKDLPAVKGMPHGCAWGLFDKDGKRDNVGTLNLLTPEVVMEAKKEIQTGVSVALK